MDSLGTLGDIARENAGFAGQAVNRVRIAARQAGIGMGMDDLDLDKIPVPGQPRCHAEFWSGIEEGTRAQSEEFERAHRVSEQMALRSWRA